MRTAKTVALLFLALTMAACTSGMKESREVTVPEETADSASEEKEDRSLSVHTAEPPLPETGRLDGFSYVIFKESYYDQANRERGYITLENTGKKGRWRISAGEKSSGGYGLALMDIREEDGTVKVILRETEPDPESTVTMALTYPALTLRLSPCPGSVVSENEDGTVFERLATPWEEPRRAVMTNGIRYLDTGYPAAPILRCGTMDGSPQSVIERDQMPEANGEANFETTGWQTTVGTDTIFVLIDGEFRIFAREYTACADGKEIPPGVFSFMATVEELRDDGIVVCTDDQVEDSLVLKKNTRYLVPQSAYDPGVYIDIPAAGNVVIVTCSGRIEEGDPVRMLDVYQVSPIGSYFMQEYEIE